MKNTIRMQVSSFVLSLSKCIHVYFSHMHYRIRPAIWQTSFYIGIINARIKTMKEILIPRSLFFFFFLFFFFRGRIAQERREFVHDCIGRGSIASPRSHLSRDSEKKENKRTDVVICISNNRSRLSFRYSKPLEMVSATMPLSRKKPSFFLSS